MTENEVQQAVAELSHRTDQELLEIVANDEELPQAILSSNPDMAQDAGFELFDAGWAKRYARRVLSHVSGKPLDEIYSWALKATVAGVALMIIQHYQLSATAVAAAVALAVILLKAVTEKDPDRQK